MYTVKVKVIETVDAKMNQYGDKVVTPAKALTVVDVYLEVDSESPADVRHKIDGVLDGAGII